MILSEIGFVSLILGIVGLILGIFTTLLIDVFSSNSKIKKANETAENLKLNATNKATEIITNAQNEGKSVVKELKAEAEEEIRTKKKELSDQENRLLQREANIDKRDASLQSKEAMLDNKQNQLHQRSDDLDKREKSLEEKENSIDEQIENIAKLTVNQAKEKIMEIAKEKSALDVAKFLKEAEENAHDKANSKAQNILALAIEKYSQDVANERTTSSVTLPSDDLKGRIIGRDGRNIRAIEQLTGVDLIVDDTPEVITVSCFDPIRREIAKHSLEILIKDGRIQPGRIEEIVNKSKEEINEIIHKAGEDTLFELGINNMAKEITDTIGKLKYRTSYGQNGLQHSKQVAILCGLMAAELGADQMLAKRCGLLHDLGKALDFEQEGSHVDLGVKMAKKYGENDVVLNAIEAHHGQVEPQTLYANLVIAADTLSAARPGARSESMENYIERIEKLESISKGFKGVKEAFAISAGREIRVMVTPEEVDDLKSYKLAKDIREKIENELTYPGQIKVTVIREVRANEIAK